MKMTFEKQFGTNVVDAMIGYVSVAKIIYNTEKKLYTVISCIDNKLIDEVISEDLAKLSIKHYLFDNINDIDIGYVDVTNNDGCKELPKLIEAEIAIIKKHLARHKYFNSIKDETSAMISFSKNFGWIMKEFYCVHVCKLKGECKHSKDLRNGAIEDNPEGLK